MGIESGRSPGVPDRNVETSRTGGCCDEKALLHSSCRESETIDSTSWDGRSERRRQYKTESNCQADHVLTISIPWRVAAVVIELQLSAKAWNRLVHDSSNGEPIGRIRTIRALRR